MYLGGLWGLTCFWTKAPEATEGSCSFSHPKPKTDTEQQEVQLKTTHDERFYSSQEVKLQQKMMAYKRKTSAEVRNVPAVSLSGFLMLLFMC